MRHVEPQVRLIAKPSADFAAIAEYLAEVGGEPWLNRVAPEGEFLSPDAEAVAEFAGRACYRSWAEGLNPNVTQVRKDSTDYLQNVVKVAHGSVFEHVSFTFVFSDVSRVFTHELVRHKAGTAVSQESLRFVRLDDLPFWFPEWALADDELMARSLDLLQRMEEHQRWMADHFGLDDEGVPFSFKKHRTSFMRRFAPEGVGTMIVWTANVRSLRHVIEMRTAAGAEEEIRLVFHRVAQRVREEVPGLMLDYELRPVDGSDIPEWIPGTRKV